MPVVCTWIRVVAPPSPAWSCPSGIRTRLNAFAPFRAGRRYDGTIRNAAGNVVQFLYGEDGMDGQRIETQSMEHLKLSGQALSRRYQFTSVRGRAGTLAGPVLWQLASLRGRRRTAWPQFACFPACAVRLPVFALRRDAITKISFWFLLPLQALLESPPHWLDPADAEELRAPRSAARELADGEWAAILEDLEILRHEVRFRWTFASLSGVCMHVASLACVISTRCACSTLACLPGI